MPRCGAGGGECGAPRWGGRARERAGGDLGGDLGGAGGAAGKAKGGFNAGGGTVILVTGTKPLPGSLTLAAAAGTSGAGTATAGTVVTVYNIAATNTDPGS